MLRSAQAARRRVSGSPPAGAGVAAATRMAETARYIGLGTFEFLVEGDGFVDDATQLPHHLVTRHLT